MLETTDSIAAAFDAGDFMRVALEGRADQWQYHAARGLIRDPDESIRALGRFDLPEARFYSAVLEWMAGRDEEACRGLREVEGAHARNLRALISKPQIEVLAQLPPVRHGAHVLADGARHDRKFKVANVGFQDGDVPNAPYRGAQELARSLAAPDFYVCYAVEWHPIPVDLQELGCPAIAFTNDFDMHIQGVARWLPTFDHRVVIDHIVEWPKVAAIGRGPTASYPIVFGAPPTPAFSRQRDIDVFISGTMFAGYHPDKSRQLHQLFDIPGIKLAVVDGHLAPDVYLELLARSKITPTFCRHRGGIQTRVIEALAMGSISIVQPDSIMKLWLDESRGLFEYDESIGPRPVVERILAQYEKIGSDCREGIATLRRAFEAKSVASRFLRFCTFLAAKPARGRPPRDPWLTQKRVHFAHGVQLRPALSAALTRQNCVRLTSELQAEPSARALIDRARERLLPYARGLYDGRRDEAPLADLGAALSDLKAACAEFPESLVAHFDLLRVLVHFGADGVGLEPIKDLAFRILDLPADRWRIDPAEDVFPYDLVSSWFDYRSYLDLVVDRLGGRTVPDAAFTALILAAVNHYVAVLMGSVAHAERAVELNPAFPFFKLTLAEMLARQPDGGSRRRAEGLLRELAASSLVGVRAGRQLEALAERSGAVMDGLEAVKERIRRMEASVVQTEHHHLKMTSPYFQMENVRAGLHHGSKIHKTSPGAARREISVVVCGQGGGRCEAVMSKLHQQEVARARFELMYVDCYEAPSEPILRLSDWAASLNQRDFLDHRAAAIGYAVAHCQSEVIAIVAPGAVVSATFMTALLNLFYGNGASEDRRAIARPMLFVDVVHEPQVVAFRAEDYRKVGGIDQAELFMGNDGALWDLAARLSRTGIPAVTPGRAGLVLRDVLPQWKVDVVSQRKHLVEMSRVIWPELFDEARISCGVAQPPELLETIGDCNIIHYRSLYYLAPHYVGSPDWEYVSKNGHPEIFATASLDNARRVALQRSKPAVDLLGA